MNYKPGVELQGMHPLMFPVLLAASEAERERGMEVWVTSITDGVHSGPKSFHYVGFAIDFDEVSEDRNIELGEAMEGKLPEQYQIVAKPSHVHVEFDPRGLIHSERTS